MSSKEIIQSYLDRDLFDAVGEETVKKMIRKDTQNRLSDTEVQLLALIFQRRHDVTNMARVRDDISNLDLVHVVSDDLRTESKDNDAYLLDFIKKLDTLNDALTTNITKLDKQRTKLTDTFEKNLTEAGILSVDIPNDYAGVTNEIHEFVNKKS